LIKIYPHNPPPVLFYYYTMLTQNLEEPFLIDKKSESITQKGF